MGGCCCLRGIKWSVSLQVGMVTSSWKERKSFKNKNLLLRSLFHPDSNEEQVHDLRLALSHAQIENGNLHVCTAEDNHLARQQLETTAVL